MRALHIVQIGTDDSVFDAVAPSDMLRRQLWYGEILAGKSPNSRLTCLIITKRVDAKSVHHDNVSFIPLRSIRFIKNIIIWMALHKLHREREIDVISPQDVDSAGWIVPVFGKLYAVPTVAQINYDLFSPYSIRDHMGTGIAGWFRKMLTFFFLRRFSAVRVVGKANRTIILEKGLHSDVAVIPVAVTELESPRELNQHRHEMPRVLYVGRLSHEKNLLLWLEIAKQIHDKYPEVKFDIVGVGPMERRLKEMVTELGLSECVQFHGFVPNEKLADMYRSASIFLLTSFYEGLPRVLVEACAYGVPPVAPRRPWAEDVVIDQETGYLCNPDDIVEMADKALALIRSRELRQKMGRAGDEYVSKNFAPRKLAEEWVDWLIHVVPTDLTIPPLRPTLKRWWRQSATQYSIFRGLEYERINGLTLHNRTLDVGGGRHISYSHLLVIKGEVESINIDPKIQPTFVADLNQPMPLKDAVYDNFISLNTFEHIWRDDIAIREAFRVLKPGGRFHITVPFLYIVHGSPFDYHRHTASWWSDYISSLGVPRDNIIIEPLMWDAISTGFALSEFQISFRALRRKLVMLPAVIRNLRWIGQERLPRLLGERHAPYALGYYIYGTK